MPDILALQALPSLASLNLEPLHLVGDDEGCLLCSYTCSYTSD
jgi:hypothetical protein